MGRESFFQCRKLEDCTIDIIGKVLDLWDDLIKTMYSWSWVKDITSNEDISPFKGKSYMYKLLGAIQERELYGGRRIHIIVSGGGERKTNLPSARFLHFYKRAIKERDGNNLFHPWYFVDKAIGEAEQLDHAKIFLFSKANIRGKLRNNVACVSSSNFYGGSVSDKIQDMVCTYGNKKIYDRIAEGYWMLLPNGNYAPNISTFDKIKHVDDENLVTEDNSNQYREWYDHLFDPTSQGYITWKALSPYDEEDFDEFTPLAIDFEMFNYDSNDDLRDHIKVVTFGKTLPTQYDLNNAYNGTCNNYKQSYACAAEKFLLTKLPKSLTGQPGYAFFVQAQYDDSFYYRFHKENFDLRTAFEDFEDNVYLIANLAESGSTPSGSAFYNIGHWGFRKHRVPETHTKILHIRNLDETIVLMGSRNAKNCNTNDIDFYIKDKAGTQSDIIHHYNRFNEYLKSLCVKLEEVDDEAIYSYSESYCKDIPP
jgi:hypothetical protein